MIKRAILSLCAVFVIFSLIYFVIDKLKEFAVENVAKGAKSERLQINANKSSVKQNTNDYVKQSIAKKSEVEKLNNQKENNQKTNHLEHKNKTTQSNKMIQNQKVVYLTFDDGPNALTSKILDVLRNEKIHATFFMIGRNLYDHQEVVKRAVREGNFIGAHSMTHDYHQLYKQGHFVSEMKQTLSIIHQLTGENTRLVRAPYGSRPGLNLKLRNDSVNAGFKIWDWNVDTHDWERTANASTVVNEVKKQVNQNTVVILLHEKQATLNALPEIISYLRDKGYAFKRYNTNEHFSVNFWNDRRF